MDRDEFMELVYETFADEPDNVLANGIIEAADAYVEYEKAQLSQEGTTKDTTSDTISRQAAVDVITRLVKGIEDICADIRERHVDDSVCGLCEYDGAYIGQSGEWCNECPGFGKDDCFKLRENYLKGWLDQLPPVPEHSEELLDDGTLMLECDSDISKVTRVNVRQRGTHYGDLYYPEGDEKTGRWVKIIPAGIYECSECGKTVMTGDIEAYERCHGCGIKMEVDG